jgi:hypothetical protein
MSAEDVTAEPAAAEEVDDDASSQSSDDGVQVVLLHSDDEEGEEADEEAAGADTLQEAAEVMDAEQAEAGGEMGAATPGAQPPTASRMCSTCSSAGGSAAQSATRHKQYVRPGLSGSAASAAGAGSASASKPSLTKAQREKLGPLAHVPGGTEMSFEPPLPDNIDIDQLQEKPWRKPEVDMTDYFNYGFNEDTWRLYCKRQQEMRMETRNLFAQQQVPTYDGMAGGGGSGGGGRSGGGGGRSGGGNMGGGNMGGGNMGCGGGMDGFSCGGAGMGCGGGGGMGGGGMGGCIGGFGESFGPNRNNNRGGGNNRFQPY